MRHYAIALCLCCTGSISSYANASSVAASPNVVDQRAALFWLTASSRNSAKIAADRILAITDASVNNPSIGNELYSDATDRIKSVYPNPKELSTFVAKMRANLGPVESRVFESVNGGFRKLPGVSEGQYVIAVYNTKFLKDQYIYTEEITLMQRPDATHEHWEFSGYYVGVKPYFKY